MAWPGAIATAVEGCCSMHISTQQPSLKMLFYIHELLPIHSSTRLVRSQCLCCLRLLAMRLILVYLLFLWLVANAIKP